MKKLLALLALAAPVFAFSPAVLARPQDDDHGKHRAGTSTATMMMTTATATTTASTRAGTSIATATTINGITMAGAFDPAITIRTGVTRTFVM